MTKKLGTSMEPGDSIAHKQQVLVNELVSVLGGRMQRVLSGPAGQRSTAKCMMVW